MKTAPITAREWQSVAILSVGFGLVGIDRFLISTMYPTIASDLGLDYGDLGTITGVLALAWGVAALFMGNLSDRIGHRPVLVVSLIIFSLLIGGSGLASGLVGLIMVRAVMGFADGAFTPASIAATVQASPPERHGVNVGLQQAMLVLFGLGLSPLLVGYLLREGIDWRYIFAIFTLPGLLIAWLTWRIIPPLHSSPDKRDSMSDWRTVLRYRNVRLLMAGMFCWLTCLIITSAFLPSYLIDHLKLGTSEMSSIMSAIGFGAVAGTILLSMLSDRIGRKPVMILSSLGALTGLLVLGTLGTSSINLFICLFAIHFFNNALITLTVGPIAAETVPLALMTTASGVVIAAGEILGGGLAPMLGGWVAQSFGIEHILSLPILTMIAGVFICLGLEETRERKATT